MASVEFALATLRNELGTGHGRPDLPRLRPRHGQLAVDTADTYGQWVPSMTCLLVTRNI